MTNASKWIFNYAIGMMGMMWNLLSLLFHSTLLGSLFLNNLVQIKRIANQIIKLIVFEMNSICSVHDEVVEVVCEGFLELEQVVTTSAKQSIQLIILFVVITPLHDVVVIASVMLCGRLISLSNCWGRRRRRGGKH